MSIQDEFVPDPKVCKEFGITAMKLLRWDQDPQPNFPPPVKIRKPLSTHP